ncbi:MAG: DUF1800 domain-containing protein [Saprospiraceae bacterium]|nr:DUF1800 domain-containing protein [Saprospiraceae bacterium]
MPAHADFPLEKPRPSENTGTLVAGPLDAYVPSAGKPWDARRVAHLYRRLGFGASFEQIQQGLQMSPSELVDQLLDGAAGQVPPAPPVWANWTSADYGLNPTLTEAHRRELRHRWLFDMLGESVRAKMALFWHNHFVTELFVYGCNAYLWSYYELIHRSAFGNFRDFTLEMGKNPAMLVYLNGNVNVVGEPNENYARELMELFTMGEGNGYNQLDVVEMSRALTGWTASFNDCTPPEFNPTRFDNNPKTIFGKTDNYTFDTAHQLIFTERAEETSMFIVKKIYQRFVYQTTYFPVVQGLAELFRASDWELLPVLKQLFKSEHFFDEELMNAHIKSPLEALLPILKMANAKYPDHIQPVWLDDITFWAQRLGQEIFGPPNVAGWKEYRSWINESTLAGRWNYAALMTQFITQRPELLDNLRTAAKGLTNDSKDAALVTKVLVEFFTGQTLDLLYQKAAVEYFKAGVPDTYFTNGTWDLNYDEVPLQIVNLLKYVVKLPEYQLS